jgi:fructose-1,6-bisphosphatase
LESLTREELIKLVQKQLANQNEAHNKQLELVKKEAEEESSNAKEQAKEMTTKVVELNKALLVIQQKVEELTAEMANQLNVEHRKHLDSAKQSEV